ncbi:unnamed protein product, partial [Mesorhabditis belari]|uniref:G-protein coupled receptors family 1 profile domain-containing protein n=1 Tax=Mesorhabditis belari TaxID=2138241 RepID=A0AAF3FGQ0_9BILA
MLIHYGAAALYIITVNIGIIGNGWVISSVLRSRRPKTNANQSSPSDRLRMYIACLATVDLTVLMALLVRTLYLLLPEMRLDIMSCKAVFLLEMAVKFGSITCLSCISIERYVTIRKPFSTKIRKRLIQLIPLVGVLVMTSILIAIFTETYSVTVTSEARNCVLRWPKSTSGWPRVAGIVIACAFTLLLAVIASNYGQIVRHVRRKFAKRKQRVVANSQRASEVNEPRYMREMTNAIIRVGVFHVVCYGPFCLLQFVPSEAIYSQLLSSLRQFDNFKDFSPLQCALFIINWLTYANAAGDWVFYAALNRDLRNLIRLMSERRKRSTLSQNCSPSNLHRSLRQQVASSLRFFQSINSYRSSAGGSFDETMVTDGRHPSMGLPLGTHSSKSTPKTSLLSTNSTHQDSPRLYLLKKQSSSLFADDIMV